MGLVYRALSRCETGVPRKADTLTCGAWRGMDPAKTRVLENAVDFIFFKIVKDDVNQGTVDPIVASNFMDMQSLYPPVGRLILMYLFLVVPKTRP